MENNTTAVFGWLSPTRFIPCQLYQHFGVIKEDAEAVVIPEVGKMFARLDDIEQRSQEAIADGEHPEWYIYEMACDDAAYKLVGILYANGWLRVGQAEGSLHIEGKPEAIQSRHQECVTFAESRGLVAVFEPRRDE